MITPLRSRVLALLALSVTLAGCSRSPVSPIGSGQGSAEQTAVTTTLASSPEFTSDSLMDVGSTPSPFGAQWTGPAGPAAAITPRYWWRTISSAERSLTFAFSDSDSTGRPRQADVTVTRHLLGQLNIYKAMEGDTMHLDSANVVHKPIDDTWVRHLRLRRFVFHESGQSVWFVTGVSGVNVTSNPTSESIQSVRVQATGLDTTLTDPAALWTLPQLCHVAPGDSLMLTATTSHTDDIVLAYWHDRRERFHANGDGTYSFKLRLGDSELNGPRFFAVNALSHDTLYDDTLPYDSAAWIFYCVVGSAATGPHF